MNKETFQIGDWVLTCDLPGRAIITGKDFICSFGEPVKELWRVTCYDGLSSIAASYCEQSLVKVPEGKLTEEEKGFTKYLLNERSKMDKETEIQKAKVSGD